jgi:short-subunit dehydrogenase
MRDIGRREKLEKAAREAGVREQIEIHALDVTKAEQIAKLSRTVAERGTPLHALINNAGYSLRGFAATVTTEELRQQFETNFFGATAVTLAFLPQMIQQTFGHILMMSSVLGRMSYPGASSYVASKFALEGWSESLRLELKGSGIHVVLVEPGAYQTDLYTRNATLAAGAHKPPRTPADRVSGWRGKLTLNRDHPDPQEVADAMAEILERPRPKLRYLIGTSAKSALWMRRVLPGSLFDWIILKLSEMDQ